MTVELRNLRHRRKIDVGRKHRCRKKRTEGSNVDRYRPGGKKTASGGGRRSARRKKKKKKKTRPLQNEGEEIDLGEERPQTSQGGGGEGGGGNGRGSEGGHTLKGSS